MDINILKTFLEVHRTCHFGNAAENLFVTQATVSVRIRQLEDELYNFSTVTGIISSSLLRDINFSVMLNQF